MDGCLCAAPEKLLMAYHGSISTWSIATWFITWIGLCCIHFSCHAYPDIMFNANSVGGWWAIQADTLRDNDVVVKSKRCHFDVITSKWHRFHVITTLSLRHVFNGMHRSLYHMFTPVISHHSIAFIYISNKLWITRSKKRAAVLLQTYV